MSEITLFHPKLFIMLPQHIPLLILSETLRLQRKLTTTLVLPYSKEHHHTHREQGNSKGDNNTLPTKHHTSVFWWVAFVAVVVIVCWFFGGFFAFCRFGIILAAGVSCVLDSFAF